MKLNFKRWLEIFGGHTPPRQNPVDPDPAPGQTHAFPTISLDKRDLPPTPNHRKMKKKMKKK